jgi:hypothetical protein
LILALSLSLSLTLAVAAIAETHRPEVVLAAAAGDRTTTAAAEFVLSAGVALAAVVASVVQGLNGEFRDSRGASGLDRQGRGNVARIKDRRKPPSRSFSSSGASWFSPAS